MKITRIGDPICMEAACPYFQQNKASSCRCMEPDFQHEPIHPTYGTLDQLLAEIKRDTLQGYELRIGLLGALSWFANRSERNDKRRAP